MKETVLVTGAAGFIGSHLVEQLLHLDYDVIGLDNFDNFYDPAIKRENIRSLEGNKGCRIIAGDIRNSVFLTSVFYQNNIRWVVHLAARAGVRPSLRQPLLYQDVNIGGTINLLELSHEFNVKRFIFTSSSSVYGPNAALPFKEDAKIDDPTSPYAASKAGAELFCRTYNYIYNLPVTILRLFTVYGPRQRPEMAIHLFTRMIDAGEEISVYGDGTSKRDYTYIDDIVDGIVRGLTQEQKGLETFNLGNSHPIALEYLIHLLENVLGKKTRIKYLPAQLVDIPVTFADITKAGITLGYKPKISIEEGVALFARWYRQSIGSKKVSPIRGTI